MVALVAGQAIAFASELLAGGADDKIGGVTERRTARAVASMARTDARKFGSVNTGQAKAGVICGIAGIVLSVGFIVVIGITSSS